MFNVLPKLRVQARKLKLNHRLFDRKYLLFPNILSNFYHKNISISVAFKTEISQFYDHMIYFHGTIKSDIIFHWLQNLKYFKSFYDWYLLISSRKWAQTRKMRINQMGHVQARHILSYLQGIAVCEWLLKFISW